MQTMTADHEITEHAQKLLDILRVRGEWVSRTHLAKDMSRNRLTPYDVGLLQDMVDKGIIEMRQRQNKTPIGFVYEYRAK